LKKNSKEAMKKYQPIDLSRVKTYPVKKRKTKVALKAFAQPPSRGASFEKFYHSLPKFLAVNSLRAVVAAIVLAHKRKRPVILGLGAHVIKVGLNPLVIDLMKKRIVTCVALNGAGAIHDFETATLGRTSEDVGEGLETGKFGMVEETMRDMNQSIRGSGDQRIRGMGKILGEKLIAMKAPQRKLSILATGAGLDIPVTVHSAIGTDTIHMSPYVDAKALGEATFTDFRLLCSVLCDLEGGVYLNIGSAVILPEVFLKALTVARNLGNKIKNFTTVNLDMIQHYRPRQNVLSRPGGKAYALTGHHEIMLPLLCQAVVESL
jgi:deoxyhypusine synthase